MIHTMIYFSNILRKKYISELFDNIILIYDIEASVIIKILSTLLDKCLKNYIRHNNEYV